MLNQDLENQREKALDLIKLKGPLLPVQVSKEIGTDIIFAGALLSELVRSNKVKLTTVKLGGSPFYYIDGQESKLQELIKHLNEKDQETAQLLKEKRILKDSECIPLTRVSLRQIKDFAKPINATISGQKETFWRYYLIEESEAKNLIIDLIKKPEQQQKLQETPPKEIKPSQQEVKKQEPLVTPPPKEISQEIKKPEIKEKRPSFTPVKDYLDSVKAKIIEEKTIKKNKDINFIIKLDTKIGKLDFFVKFRNKKRINDSDLVLAINEAKNLPLLFLSTGTLTKKAQKLMEQEFKGIVFKQIST